MDRALEKPHPDPRLLRGDSCAQRQHLKAVPTTWEPGQGDLLHFTPAGVNDHRAGVLGGVQVTRREEMNPSVCSSPSRS